MSTPTSSGCRRRWPGASRWPRRASPTRGPPAPVGTRQLRRMVDRLAVVQIDSVNVLSRSHYLPAFSRLGAYPRAGARRRWPAGGTTLFEYWAHEASLPAGRGCSRYLRWRMAAAEQHAWGNMVRLQRERPGYVAEVLDRVRDGGPAQGQRPARSPGRTGPASMWNWHAGKVALEWLFFTGALTARGADDGFERVYDLTERVLPPEVAAAPDPGPRRRRSASWCGPPPGRSGVATERDLRDYFRLQPRRRPRGDRRARRGAASCSRSRSPAGVAPAWLRPGGAAAAVDPGPGAAQPVRLAGVGAPAGGADLRLPLPAGDLHAGGQAGARLLRAALPARRPAGRPGRPQGRPAGRACCGCRPRTPRQGVDRGAGRPRAGRGAAADGRLARAGRRRRRRPRATWQRTSPAAAGAVAPRRG